MRTNRLTHGAGTGRTEIRLAAGDPLLVLESPRDVLAQVDDATWSVLQLDDDTEVHVRSSAVVAIIDLNRKEGLRPVA